MSYCSDRLKALKITEKANKWKALTPDNRTIDFRFFMPDDKDNIDIGYIAPDGYVVQYETENRKIRDFKRTRLKEPKPGQGKYVQPPETETYAFCTPAILKAYKDKEKLKTLYIVEGEFKAFALSNFGLPAMGIGGIQNFKDKNKAYIHPFILDVCKVCQVENIELIHDADAFKMEWKEGQELTTRPNDFYSSVNTFNELLKPYDIQLYYAHVVKDSDFKGIDDLLYGVVDQNLVIEEVKSLLAGAKERKYILTYQITGISSFRIKQIFGIDSAQSFYEMNQSELENREFVYRGEYYFVNGEGKLQVSWKGEQRNYLRIGVDYYKRVLDIDADGQTEIKIDKWTEKTIRDDFHNSKEFLKNIIKCDAFTNVPENDPDKYQRIIHVEKETVKSVLYNRYEPIYHVPKEGDWRTINKLLHHIFDYRNLDGDPLYEFALDYIQLLYTQPRKHLPILCLVSSERKTGKTTFLRLMKSIFLENMSTLDSQRLISNFNSMMAGKLVVGVDESFINMDEKNGAGNKLKMLATNPTIPIEQKGKDAKEIPNFVKLILCSNDESNFVKIDWEENRYAIIKVTSIEGEEDPAMHDIMKAEIPAFLWFLKQRPMYYPEKSRLWFEERVFKTPQLAAIQERTESGLIRNTKDVIRDQFYYQGQEKIRLSLSVIEELVKIQYRFANKLMIRDYLNDKGYRVGPPVSFTYYYSHEDKIGITKKDRCYTFDINEFLTPEEVQELKNTNDNELQDKNLTL